MLFHRDICTRRPGAVVSFLYLAFGSMFLGFFAWNVGLAMGGIAQVSQVQLLQTFVTIAISALMLGEVITLDTVLFALAVMAIVTLGRKTRVTRNRHGKRPVSRPFSTYSDGLLTVPEPGPAPPASSFQSPGRLGRLGSRPGGTGCVCWVARIDALRRGGVGTAVTACGYAEKCNRGNAR